MGVAMNPIGFVPLALAGFHGTIAVILIKNALNPEAAMERWCRRTEVENVVPDRGRIVRNYGIRLWVCGAFLAIIAMVMLFLAVLAFSSPTSEELHQQQKASQAAHRRDMERRRAELERQNSDPFRVRPLTIETRP
jgi:hypothetical protein